MRRCILVQRNLRDAMEATLYFVIAGAVGNYLLFSRRRRARLHRAAVRFPGYEGGS